jgi:hypothetical protein
MLLEKGGIEGEEAGDWGWGSAADVGDDGPGTLARFSVSFMVGFSGPFAPRSVDRLLWDTQMPVFQELGIMLIIAAIGICFLVLGAYAMRTPENS